MRTLFHTLCNIIVSTQHQTDCSKCAEQVLYMVKCITGFIPKWIVHKTFHPGRFTADFQFSRQRALCSLSEVKDGWNEEAEERRVVPHEINVKAILNGYLYRLIYYIRFASGQRWIIQEQKKGTEKMWIWIWETWSQKSKKSAEHFFVSSFWQA